jgi:mannose-1-phosphate guanylyltransferase
MKAIVMAGGQGTRFWPLSREDKPKQFLNIAGGATMLQRTVERLQPVVTLPDVYVVCSRRYVHLVREQLPLLSKEQVIVEPSARNTAPCLGLSAFYLKRQAGAAQASDTIMVALPADHLIEDLNEFHDALQAAAELARQGWLVTFGIEPSYPATGYGYLQRGERIVGGSSRPTYRVSRFTEKPDEETACRFLEQGGYYWNSGMFVWTLDTLLSEMQRLMPDLYAGLKEMAEDWADQDKALRLFSRFSSLSIDYGVMERAARVAVLPCRLGWSDVGNWRSLEDVWQGDEDRVFANTPRLSIDSNDCILYTSSGKLVVLIGSQNLVVVDTPDALLVCSKDRTEDVKKVVERLLKEGLQKYL